MLLRPDDDAFHPYMGAPRIRWPVEITLKLRTAAEWTIMGVLLVALWVPMWRAVWLITGHVIIVAGPGWAGGLWWTSGLTATWVHKRFVNRDRPVAFYRSLIVTETYRWFRSRGPIDPAVATVGFVTWVTLNRITARALTGIWHTLAIIAAIPVATLIARHIIARVESPERAWRHQRARERLRPLSTASPTRIVTSTKGISR